MSLKVIKGKKGDMSIFGVMAIIVLIILIALFFFIINNFPELLTNTLNNTFNST
ncbi:hypothetical protein [Methanococcus voltae]|uniref:Uncharacterized protein (UPF0333 family) n=2 Tax=Methanococcus voltae TaxID=2188 RepID=A0A8J7URP5_METVO|nr:hypothetical protein [Methanococcus voltae]MBP2172941.1 uncharacterized protein (UPF0333 family) [Methanococcus voltae]MBP2202003.1 uncharacterized protein (UPF0333 family) [Methanococcus voltae]MCS3922166.1 uncharacterized protein (UPF0333 family) [Methanococcus voltae PS]